MGISIWQLLIILAIVVVLFGTKRLSGLGSDLGAAIKGFTIWALANRPWAMKHRPQARLSRRHAWILLPSTTSRVTSSPVFAAPARSHHV